MEGREGGRLQITRGAARAELGRSYGIDGTDMKVGCVHLTPLSCGRCSNSNFCIFSKPRMNNLHQRFVFTERICAADGLHADAGYGRVTSKCPVTLRRRQVCP